MNDRPKKKKHPDLPQIKKSALHAYSLALSHCASYFPRVESSTAYLTVMKEYMNNFNYELVIAKNPDDANSEKLILSFIGVKRFTRIRKKMKIEDKTTFIASFDRTPVVLHILFPLTFKELKYLPEAVARAFEVIGGRNENH